MKCIIHFLIISAFISLAALTNAQAINFFANEKALFVNLRYQFMKTPLGINDSSPALS